MSETTAACPKCGKHITPKNMARHMQQHGGISREAKQAQVQCHVCGKWGVVSQRVRHYRELHQMEPPTLDKTQIRQPVRTEVTVRRRVNSERQSQGQPRTHMPAASPVPNPALTTPTNGSSSPASSLIPSSRTTDRRVSPDDVVASYANRNAVRTQTILHTIEESASIAQRVHNTVEIQDLSRLLEEIPEYAQIWRQAKRARAISVDEYFEMYRRGHLTPDQNRYVYVVAQNMAAARLILQDHLPLRMIVVPRAGTPVLNLDKYMQELRSRDNIHVTDFDLPVDVTNRQPTAIKGVEVVKAFLAQPPRHLNLLNLSSSLDNPVPGCLQDLPQYDVLTRLKGDGNAGKAAEYRFADLTNCATFQVCSKAGVWSDAHTDHYAMLTSVFMECGEKAWLTWPTLSTEEKEAWARLGPGSCPPIPAFNLTLGRSDLLIQPPRTVHAPYTSIDCIASGTQHLHSPSLHIHLEAANHERKHTHVTNEDEASEALLKFKMIVREMEAQNPRWPWPDSAAQHRVRAALKEYEAGFQQPVSCRCRSDCRTNANCACRKAGMQCHKHCHPQTKGKCTL